MGARLVIRTTTCYTLTCDRGCEYGGWGDDGPFHFDTEAAAVDYAKKCGFVIVGDLMLCEDCAAKADCAATGHQWGNWWEPRQMEGVTYRTRYCEHCDASDHDPPWRELVTLVDAARIVNGGTPC